jgi:hypothetical protein
MAISKYNLTRFILDEAYSDCENTCNLGDDDPLLINAQWDNWLHKVSRIYNHQIPSSLLEGLRRKKNRFLEDFIKNHETRLQEKNSKKLSSMNEYNRWAKRVNEGNKRL